MVEPVAAQGLVAAAYLPDYRLIGADWAGLAAHHSSEFTSGDKRMAMAQLLLSLLLVLLSSDCGGRPAPSMAPPPDGVQWR